MDAADLKKIVAILYDMELNNYYMNKTINDIKKRIAESSIVEDYKKETLYNKDFDFSLGETMQLSSFVCAIIGTICGLIYGGIFDALAIAIGSALMGAGIGVIIWGIFKIRDFVYSEKDYEIHREHLAKERDYKDILMKKCELIEKKKQESECILRRYYHMSGIDDRFCNFMAIGYMHEFLTLGISQKLEGSDGLYYLIMKEIRWEQMQYTFEDISRKLDMVINNQKMMHADLVRMNEQSQNMADRIIKEMQYNSRDNKLIEDYNSNRIAKELEYQNYMMKYGI